MNQGQRRLKDKQPYFRLNQKICTTPFQEIFNTRVTKCTRKYRQAWNGVRMCIFLFLKFYNFIKGIAHIYIVLLKMLKPLFLYLTELMNLCLNNLTTAYALLVSFNQAPFSFPVYANIPFKCL